jgi:choline-sulfatase
MPRNVLVFLTDDHAQWCAGAYGHDAVHTPTIDHLAASGTRMANAFCPTPVCSPARASFYTGRLPSQHGVHDHISPDADGQGWLDGETTLPELFGAAGYETALFGKWHCGQPEQDEAFEHAFGVRDADGYRPWYATLDGDRRVTDRALEFLRDGRDADRPFFGVVGYTATHSPWEGNPERLVAPYRETVSVPAEPTYPFGGPSNEGVAAQNWNRNARETRAQYCAAVEGIDAQAGRVLDCLDRQGLREETLVVYTADHGLNLGEHDVWGKGNATRPANALEESVRVPLVWNGPDVRAGQTRREFVDHCDTFAALLDYADIDPPAADRPGRSYRPMVTDAAPVPDWKDVQVGEYGPTRWARSERYKLLRRAYDAPDLLVDLEADLRECRNVLDDPEHADAVERLDATLEATFEELAPLAHDGTDVANLAWHNGGPAWSDATGTE